MITRSLLRASLVSTTLALIAAVCLPVRAAERVTLRNGSEIDCLRREPAGDRVRLYLIPAAGTKPTSDDASYIEVSAASVLRVDIVPDPPAPPAAEPTPSLLSSRSSPLLSSRSSPLLSSRSSPLLSSRSGAEGSAYPLTPADIPELLARAGSLHNIDADLLASVVQAESAGNARAVSRAGAQGLMQLMPSTAALLGVSDSFAPDQNISAGTAYLDQLLTRYHDDITLAVAAYNAGPAAVDRYRGIPPYAETRAYVARVVREFNRRKRAVAATLTANAH